MVNVARLNDLITHDRIQPLFLMGIRGVTLVSKFILTLFIAKYMGFADLGVYGLIIAATFIVRSFLGLGVMYTKSRTAITQSMSEIAETLHYYTRHISLSYLVLLPFVAAYGIYDGSVLSWIAVVAIIFFEHINNDLYNLLLNLSRPIVANILHFVRSALWVFIFIGVAYIFPEFRKMEYLLLFWILCSTVSVAGFLFLRRQWKWKKEVSSPSLKRWVLDEFKVSKTPYKNMILESVSTYLNVYLITFFLGIELTGIYVYFMQATTAILNLLRTGIIQMARPKLTKAYVEGSSNFFDIYHKYKKDTFIMSLIIGLIAVPALYAMTLYVVDKPLALEWFALFIGLLVSMVVMLITEVNDLIFYARKEDKVILYNNLIVLAVIVVLNVALLGVVGLWATAIALTAAYALKCYRQGLLINKVKTI